MPQDSVMSWAILTVVVVTLIICFVARVVYEEKRKEEEDEWFWRDWERIKYDDRGDL